MSMSRRALAGALLSLAALAPAAHAQSTDGYHAIQVLPVVVDTASFVQRFNFHGHNPGAVVVTPKYYPAIGTSAIPITCPTITIPSFGEKVVDSLRTLCPAIPAGSQFGYLVLYPQDPHQTYSAFSRVSNIAGAGFTVEGFPASSFTGSRSIVTGIRRLAATPSTPSFQTNCFVGNMPEEENESGATQINIVLSSSTGAFISGGVLNLMPGQMVRLLDVFAATNAPAGDYNDALFIADEQSGQEPGIVAFCTVQDNTSFNADFRIAKQSISVINGVTVRGAQDQITAREVNVSEDVLGRPFTIPAGAFVNSHVLYIHQPDMGSCEIIDPNTGVRALPGYGLEIRATDGEETGAGGNDSTAVPDTGKGEVNYFGDRIDGPENSRVIIEVESNGQNTGNARPYRLRCRTGSGTNQLDLIEYQAPGTRF